MKPRRIHAGIFIFITMMIIASCGLQESSIEKLWFYTHSDGVLTNRDTLLTPASFLNIKKDGTYTYDLDKFEYGTWKQEKNRIIFTNSHKQRSTVKIEQLSSKEMRLAIKNFTPANFESKKVKFKSVNENPFSTENNLWRVRADKKETDEQLRIRLLNHLHFWEVYFAWALDDQLMSIDVRSTPTLLKIYGNGFALKPFDQLPAKWKSYFFDEDDCRRTNEMLTKVFEDSDIAWGNSDSKFKMFISAFQQLQQKMR